MQQIELQTVRLRIPQLHVLSPLWVVSQCFRDLRTSDGLQLPLGEQQWWVFVIQITANVMGKTKFTCILQEFGSALAGLINGCESLQRLINRNYVVCYLCIFPQIKLLFLILDVKNCHSLCSKTESKSTEWRHRYLWFHIPSLLTQDLFHLN